MTSGTATAFMTRRERYSRPEDSETNNPFYPEQLLKRSDQHEKSAVTYTHFSIDVIMRDRDGFS